MQTFVLIPGAWTGAWIWKQVTHELRTRGHRVHPVTLSGLEGENSDVSEVGLTTHVEDVVRTLEEHDLQNVVLVAHDYAGIVAGIVAGRAPDRVMHTVFVEAFLPHEGSSMLHAFPEDQRAEELALIVENHGRWPVPDATVMAEGQDLSMDQARWIAENAVGHPGRTLTEPARLERPLTRIAATYIVCAMNHFDGKLSDDVTAMRKHWKFRTLKTGYWPMVSAPNDLVEVLIEPTSGSGGRAG